ncbi:MAG TPA: peptidoglycan-binding protein [Acidimicrobiales bacterium]|nr:peptidoglycan-binding protein [Acidimicrobiales bacterium]
MAHRGAALPVSEGDAGDAVADIQDRLSVLGFGALSDPGGQFGIATRAALEAFQRQRGLRVDGVCGAQTWQTLVEAGHRLGDRFLFRRTPMLRGDDVAELQQRLCALGFDTGRVDGIFGDATAKALRDFQENSALPVDGILGPGTLLELRRVAARGAAPTHLVSTVRARELLRQSPPTLSGRHVAVGERGGLAAPAAALRRRLVARGASVTTLHHPDDSAQARQANSVGADAYLALRLEPDRPGILTAFYSGYRDESVGGRLLAGAIQAFLPPALGVPDLGAHGMSLTVLRETRMPAVMIEVGPAAVAVEHGPALAESLATALAAWVCGPWE